MRALRLGTVWQKDFEKIMFKTKPVFVAFGVKESWLVMRSLCTSPPTPLPQLQKSGL